MASLFPIAPTFSTLRVLVTASKVRFIVLKPRTFAQAEMSRGTSLNQTHPLT